MDQDMNINVPNDIDEFVRNTVRRIINRELAKKYIKRESLKELVQKCLKEELIKELNSKNVTLDNAAACSAGAYEKKMSINPTDQYILLLEQRITLLERQFNILIKKIRKWKNQKIQNELSKIMRNSYKEETTDRSNATSKQTNHTSSSSTDSVESIEQQSNNSVKTNILPENLNKVFCNESKSEPLKYSLCKKPGLKVTFKLPSVRLIQKLKHSNEKCNLDYSKTFNAGKTIPYSRDQAKYEKNHFDINTLFYKESTATINLNKKLIHKNGLRRRQYTPRRICTQKNDILTKLQKGELIVLNDL